MRRPVATGEGYSGARWSWDQRRDGDSEEPANAESDAQDERPVDGDGCKGVAGAMRQHRARGTVCRAAADVIGMLEAQHTPPIRSKIAPSCIALSRNSETNACF